MKYNRNYATRAGNQFIHPSIPITVAGKDHYPLSDADYLALGYKKLVPTDMPAREGYYYTSEPQDWAEDDTSFTQAWVEHEAPEPELTTQDYQDALEELGVNLNDPE